MPVQQRPMRLVHLRPQGHVDHPGLVLERDEDEALRRHRVLDADRQAGQPDAGPIAQPGRIGHRDHAARREPLAEQLDRMEVRRDAGVAIVGGDLLGIGHRRQRGAQRALGVIGQA